MLQKSQSKKLNLLKYLLILPALVGFLMSFNTKEIYINATSNPSKINKKVEKFVIESHFTNDDLEDFTRNLELNNFEFILKSIKRNDGGMITAIDFTIIKNNTGGRYSVAKGDEIGTIVIKYFIIEDKFVINTQNFIESQGRIEESNDVIQFAVDKNTTVENFEEQKKYLKENYNIDLEFKVDIKDSFGKTEIYSITVRKGKSRKKITTSSDRPNIFKYDNKSNVLTNHVLNENGDPEYGGTYVLENRKNYLILDNYKDDTLDDISESLKEYNIFISFSNIKRNEEGRIIGITINGESEIWR